MEGFSVKYICGYCRKKKQPPVNYSTFQCLIDHLVNDHRYKVEHGKLVRR